MAQREEPRPKGQMTNSDLSTILTRMTTNQVDLENNESVTKALEKNYPMGGLNARLTINRLRQFASIRGFQLRGKGKSEQFRNFITKLDEQSLEGKGGRSFATEILGLAAFRSVPGEQPEAEEKKEETEEDKEKVLVDSLRDTKTGRDSIRDFKKLSKDMKDAGVRLNDAPSLKKFLTSAVTGARKAMTGLIELADENKPIIEQFRAILLALNRQGAISNEDARDFGLRGPTLPPTPTKATRVRTPEPPPSPKRKIKAKPRPRPTTPPLPKFPKPPPPPPLPLPKPIPLPLTLDEQAEEIARDEARQGGLTESQIDALPLDDRIAQIRDDLEKEKPKEPEKAKDQPQPPPQTDPQATGTQDERADESEEQQLDAEEILRAAAEAAGTLDPQVQADIRQEEEEKADFETTPGLAAPQTTSEIQQLAAETERRQADFGQEQTQETQDRQDDDKTSEQLESASPISDQPQADTSPIADTFDLTAQTMIEDAGPQALQDISLADGTAPIQFDDPSVEDWMDVIGSVETDDTMRETQEVKERGAVIDAIDSLNGELEKFNIPSKDLVDALSHKSNEEAVAMSNTIQNALTGTDPAKRNQLVQDLNDILSDPEATIDNILTLLDQKYGAQDSEAERVREPPVVIAEGSPEAKEQADDIKEAGAEMEAGDEGGAGEQFPFVPDDIAAGVEDPFLELDPFQGPGFIETGLGAIGAAAGAVTGAVTGAVVGTGRAIGRLAAGTGRLIGRGAVGTGRAIVGTARLAGRAIGAAEDIGDVGIAVGQLAIEEADAWANGIEDFAVRQIGFLPGYTSGFLGIMARGTGKLAATTQAILESLTEMRAEPLVQSLPWTTYIKELKKTRSVGTIAMVALVTAVLTGSVYNLFQRGLQIQQDPELAPTTPLTTELFPGFEDARGVSAVDARGFLFEASLLAEPFSFPDTDPVGPFIGDPPSSGFIDPSARGLNVSSLVADVDRVAPRGTAIIPPVIVPPVVVPPTPDTAQEAAVRGMLVSAGVSLAMIGAVQAMISFARSTFGVPQDMGGPGIGLPLSGMGRLATVTGVIGSPSVPIPAGGFLHLANNAAMIAGLASVIAANNFSGLTGDQAASLIINDNMIRRSAVVEFLLGHGLAFNEGASPLVLLDLLGAALRVYRRQGDAIHRKGLPLQSFNNRKEVFKEYSYGDHPTETKADWITMFGNVVEFHPTTETHLLEIRRLIKGKKGSLFESDIRSGRQRKVDISEVRLFRHYIWIPNGHKMDRKVGGGFWSAREKHVWRENDLHAQYRHFRGARDKVYMQVHRLNGKSHKREFDRPHHHRVGQKLAGGSLWSWIKGAVQTVGRGIGKAAKFIGHGIHKAVDATGRFIIKTGRDIGRGVKDFAGNVADTAVRFGKKALGSLRNIGQLIVDPSWNHLKGAVGGLGKLVWDTGDAIIRTAGHAVDFVKNTPVINLANAAAQFVVPGLGAFETGVQAANKVVRGDFAGLGNLALDEIKGKALGFVGGKALSAIPGSIKDRVINLLPGSGGTFADEINRRQGGKLMITHHDFANQSDFVPVRLSQNKRQRAHGSKGINKNIHRRQSVQLVPSFIPKFESGGHTINQAMKDLGYELPRVEYKAHQFKTVSLGQKGKQQFLKKPTKGSTTRAKNSLSEFLLGTTDPKTQFFTLLNSVNPKRFRHRSDMTSKNIGMSVRGLIELRNEYPHFNELAVDAGFGKIVTRTLRFAKALTSSDIDSGAGFGGALFPSDMRGHQFPPTYIPRIRLSHGSRANTRCITDHMRSFEQTQHGYGGTLAGDIIRTAGKVLKTGVKTGIAVGKAVGKGAFAAGKSLGSDLKGGSLEERKSGLPNIFMVDMANKLGRADPDRMLKMDKEMGQMQERGELPVSGAGFASMKEDAEDEMVQGGNFVGFLKFQARKHSRRLAKAAVSGVIGGVKAAGKSLLGGQLFNQVLIQPERGGTFHNTGHGSSHETERDFEPGAKAEFKPVIPEPTEPSLRPITGPWSVAGHGTMLFEEEAGGGLFDAIQPRMHLGQTQVLPHFNWRRKRSKEDMRMGGKKPMRHFPKFIPAPKNLFGLGSIKTDTFGPLDQ